jgi:hypothetical protein
MTYTQLAKKWAPTSRGYSRDVAKLAELFFEGACKGDDPNPEMVAEARKGRGVETDGEVAATGKGAEIAKQVIAEARKDGAPRAGLGGEAYAAVDAPREMGSTAAGPPLKLLNSTADEPAAIGAEPPKAEATTAEPVKSEPAKAEAAKTEPAKTDPAKTDPPKTEPEKKTAKSEPSSKAEPSSKKPAKAEAAAAAAAKPEKAEAKAPAAEPAKEQKVAATEMASLSGPLLGDAKPPAVSDAKCRVFTASYGGARSIIIKAVTEGITNYTVLDVNDGAEKREAEAFIGAYARGGETVSDPQPQDKALEEAFKLCPEG